MPKFHVQQPRHKAALLIIVGRLINLAARLVWRYPARRGRGLVRAGDYILLVCTISSPSLWTLPGGGYRRGESAADCVAREVYEETGISIAAKTHSAVTKHQETLNSITWRYDCVTAAVDRPTQPTISFEIYQAGWFPLEKLPPNRSAYIDQLLT